MHPSLEPIGGQRSDDTRKDDAMRARQSHAAIPTHAAETLTKGGATAHIQLDNQTYTLRITRAGKLILTK